jgi:hypothetical protein
VPAVNWVFEALANGKANPESSEIVVSINVFRVSNVNILIIMKIGGEHGQYIQ